MSIQLITCPPVASKTAVASESSAAWSRKLLVLTACAAIALLPLVVDHFRQIGLRPHYQFFPFAIIAAVFIAIVRFRGFRPNQSGSSVITAVVFAFAVVALFVSIVLESSWLGYFAWLLTVAGSIYGVAGGTGLRRSIPVLALLALMLPPPFELDRELVFALRRISTSWSGAILDALKIPHLMAGNVVELGRSRLMVEEACSGINSLFALLTTVLFFAALFKRSLVHTIALLLAAGFWVIVANVARIITVVLADRRGLNLSEGWPHEALSIGVFLIVLPLVASTDCLISLFAGWAAALRPQRMEHPELASAPEKQPLAISKANKGFCLSWFAVSTFAAAFVLLAIMHATLNRHSEAAPTGSFVQHLQRLTAESLPESLDNWHRIDFRSDRRNVDSAFGEYSKTWTFRRGSVTALVSIDYPFTGWHDLTRCYTSQGWTSSDQKVCASSVESPGYVEVGFDRAGYQSGYLLFAEFGPTGTALQPRQGGAQLSLFRQQAAWARIKYCLGLASDCPASEPQNEVGQIQLFISSEVPLQLEQKSAAQSIFQQIYKTIHKDLW